MRMKCSGLVMEVDADGNGSIEFAEFIELMRHHYLEVDLRKLDISTCGKLLIQLSFSGKSREGFRFISINKMNAFSEYSTSKSKGSQCPS